MSLTRTRMIIVFKHSPLRLFNRHMHCTRIKQRTCETATVSMYYIPERRKSAQTPNGGNTLCKLRVSKNILHFCDR